VLGHHHRFARQHIDDVALVVLGKRYLSHHCPAGAVPLRITGPPGIHDRQTASSDIIDRIFFDLRLFDESAVSSPP